jgi:hypothetical protein
MQNNVDNINIIDNNLDNIYIKQYRRKLCKSYDKRRNNKLNINNYKFNEFKNKKNININNKPNKIKNYKAKKNDKSKKFKIMNSQDFNEYANQKTPPKKIDSFAFNKSKSCSINYQEEEKKLNFIKNAFKSYISSNKIK